MSRAAMLTTESRSGLSVTAPTGVQLLSVARPACRIAFTSCGVDRMTFPIGLNG